MSLNPARTVSELEELRTLTGNEDGAQRVAWTDTWEEAREFLRSKMADFVRHGGPVLTTVRGKGFMLGLDVQLPFVEHEAEFLPGDRLVLYTDGLVEVEREDRAMLEEAGLRRICAELPAGAEAAADAVITQARAFNHPAAFVDDVTLVILDRKG